MLIIITGWCLLPATMSQGQDARTRSDCSDCSAHEPLTKRLVQASRANNTRICVNQALTNQPPKSSSHKHDHGYPWISTDIQYTDIRGYP